MRHASIWIAVVAGLLFAVHGRADEPPEVVHWHVNAESPAASQPRAVIIDVSATVEPGWHVYALRQGRDGPTPLRLVVEDNDFARAVGEVSGSKSQREFSKSFGVVTEYYANSFKLLLPARLSEGAPPGPQQVPVSIRFQACSDRQCLLPRTVRLTATVAIPGNL